MKKRQILWAIVFGSMLAITGCGDEGSDNGGGGNSAGSGGGDFCTTLCESCGGGQADCEQVCDTGFGSIPSEFLDTCPSELDTFIACYAANDCDGDVCESEGNAWAACVTMNFTN